MNSNTNKHNMTVGDKIKIVDVSPFTKDIHNEKIIKHLGKELTIKELRGNNLIKFEGVDNFWSVLWVGYELS